MRKHYVTDTQRNTQNSSFILGDTGASATSELMKVIGQSRKDSTGPRPPASNKSLRIASWNVRTLYEAGKSTQVVKEMQRYSLHTLGISETHWIQSGQKRLSNGEQILYSGREDQRHSEGVAFILGKAAQKSLRGWEPHGERIIMASFTTRNSNINMNIVQVYTPTNDAFDEEKDVFYSLLQEILDKLPRKDINILMGDVNAKVGQDNVGYEGCMGQHGLGEMNDNGERLANICAFNNLVIGGSVFPHRRIHKATWVSPDGVTENQIDHFCISRRFRRSLEDVKVQRGADIGSDHHLLLAKLKLRLKRHGSRINTRGMKFQVNLLAKDKKEEFQMQLRNRFQPLADMEEEADVESHWKKVKEGFILTCQDVLGKKRMEDKEWISQHSMGLIQRRREMKAQVNASRTRCTRADVQELYRKAAKDVKKSIKKDKEEFVSGLAKKAEEAAAGGHMRTLYQTTKTLAGRYGKPVVPVKDQEGKTIFGKEAQSERWMDHFSSLLNQATHRTSCQQEMTC